MLVAGAQSSHADGLVTVVRPAVEAFLDAARKTSRDPVSGVVRSDEAAWERACSERERVHRLSPLGVQQTELFSLMKLAGRNTMVLLPTFARISGGDIALAFAMRTAPLGIVVEEDVFPPRVFYRHDVTHAAIYALQRLAPVERFLARKGAFMGALARFMRRADEGTKDAFFEQVHELGYDPLQTAPRESADGWEGVSSVLREDVAAELGRGQRILGPGLVDRLTESVESAEGGGP
jgi:hypothetical protein